MTWGPALPLLCWWFQGWEICLILAVNNQVIYMFAFQETKRPPWKGKGLRLLLSPVTKCSPELFRGGAASAQFSTVAFHFQGAGAKSARFSPSFCRSLPAFPQNPRSALCIRPQSGWGQETVGCCVQSPVSAPSLTGVKTSGLKRCYACCSAGAFLTPEDTSKPLSFPQPPLGSPSVREQGGVPVSAAAREGRLHHLQKPGNDHARC